MFYQPYFRLSLKTSFKKSIAKTTLNTKEHQSIKKKHESIESFEKNKNYVMNEFFTKKGYRPKQIGNIITWQLFKMKKSLNF